MSEPAAPTLLPVTALAPHPDNPRMLFREEVVERLAGWMQTDGFRPEYALIVRPLNGDYQLISGHHRKLAADRAGLAEVPCWIREMTDDEAFISLVTSNEQSELDPLERGIHARRAIELGIGGRGKRGGLSEYANAVGRAVSGISMLRDAAEVTETFQSIEGFPLADLLERSTHLIAVHAAPKQTWPILVNHLLKHGWSVAETKQWVTKIREFNIPGLHAFHLPLTEVAERFLSTREFSPRTVTQLVAATEAVWRYLDDRSDGAAERDRFDQWLIDNQGGEAWTVRGITAYHQQLIAEAFEVKGWHHGDWRHYIAELDDGSAALMLTDPPYGMGYQSDYRLDRTQPHRHEPISADGSSAASELAAAAAAMHSKLAEDAHVLVFCHWSTEQTTRVVLEAAGYTIRGSLVWAKDRTGMGDPTTTFAPKHERIIHAVKGSPVLYRRAPDVLSYPRPDATAHPTEKPVDLLAELIEATTVPGQLVTDPFGGVASTLVAAERTGRQRWGCELEERYHQLGEERLTP